MIGALLPAAVYPATAEETVTLELDGMSCAACPTIVKGSLAKVLGVRHVEVS